MLNIPALGVVDFSYSRLSGAQLQQAGAAGVIRYAAGGRTDVNITAAEYEDFTAHNIPVGITCEQSATFMLGGYDAGAREAEAAQKVTRAAGIPDGPIFFAVDFDTNQAYMPTLLSTLNGVAAAIGPFNAGTYGSYDVIDWLVRESPYVAFWQTAAWSSGRTHPHAWLIQDRIWTQATPYQLDGAAVDFSTVLGDWHPRNGDDDVLNDADKAWIQQQISNGAIEVAAALMGTRTQPHGVDPKTRTTLASISDGQYLAYRGDETHPGFVEQVAQTAEIKTAMADVQAHVGTNASVDPAFVTAVENLVGALQGGLSWTITTQTPKAAQ